MNFDFFGRNKSKLTFIFYVQADDYVCYDKKAIADMETAPRILNPAGGILLITDLVDVL